MVKKKKKNTKIESEKKKKDEEKRDTNRKIMYGYVCGLDICDSILYD